MPCGTNLNERKAIQEGNLEADVEVREVTLEAEIDIRKVNQEVNVVVDGEGVVALTENIGMYLAVGLVDLADSVDQDGAVETDRKPDVRLFRNLVMSSCRNLVVSSVQNLVLNSVRNLMVKSARS